MSGFTAYDLWKFRDYREEFDETHCPHGESLSDPCNECWEVRGSTGSKMPDVKLTNMIRKDGGKYKLSGYATEAGHRFEFSLTDATKEQADKFMKMMIHDIDATRRGAL